MKFYKSKYGIVLALVYALYFLFIYLVDPSEIGSLGFFQYVSLLFYIPIFLVSVFIPVQINSWISFIVGLIIFYLIGALIQKILGKDK